MNPFVNRACRVYSRLVLVLMVAAFSPLSGQSQNALSAAQLKWLESLSQEQREAMVERIRDGQSNTASQDTLEFPETMDHLPAEAVESELPEELRIEGGTTLVVTMTLKDEIEPADERAFSDDSNRTRLLGQRVYQVDANGVLELPGVAIVPLGGLSAEEAATRLMSEPLLSLVDVIAQILPLEPFGTAALEPFGYDLFNGVPTTFAPSPPRWPTVRCRPTRAAATCCGG